MQTGRQIKLIGAATILWLFATGAGIWSMARYVGQPGVQAEAPADFPAADFSFDSTKPTLVMLAHPRCPCTRASLSELSALLSDHPERLKTYVLFYQPSSEPEDWARTDLWQTARQIPDVTVMSDRDASAAQLFGAFTSGQILLYAPDGKLIFKGGITVGRGHEGKSEGRAAIESYLKTGDISSKTSLVYGCAITNDETSDNQIQ